MASLLAVASITSAGEDLTSAVALPVTGVSDVNVDGARSRLCVRSGALARTKSVRLIRFFGRVPVTEVALSEIFSALEFCYASIRESKVYAYYYGMILGFLIYIGSWVFQC